MISSQWLIPRFIIQMFSTKRFTDTENPEGMKKFGFCTKLARNVLQYCVLTM